MPVWFKELVIDFVNYGVPIIALLISGYSLRESKKNKKMQSRLNELEEKIRKYDLEKIEKEIEESQKACVEARIYCISKGNYRLKIWNSGKATAYNIDYSTEEGYESGIIKEYAPYEFLDPGKNFEELAVVHSGTSNKFPLTTTWEDKDGNSQSKIQIITI